jgi:hypothetical protein
MLPQAGQEKRTSQGVKTASRLSLQLEGQASQPTRLAHGRRNHHFEWRFAKKVAT